MQQQGYSGDTSTLSEAKMVVVDGVKQPVVPRIQNADSIVASHTSSTTYIMLM